MADPRFTSPVGDAMALDSTNITGKTAIVTGGMWHFYFYHTEK